MQASRPWTSDAAWERVVPKLSGLRRHVLETFVEYEALRPGKGLTDEDGVFMSNPRLAPSTYRTRRSELVRMGWLRDSGRTRTLESGGQGVVWELTGEVGEVAPPKPPTRKELRGWLREALRLATHQYPCLRPCARTLPCTCGLSALLEQIPEDYR